MINYLVGAIIVASIAGAMSFIVTEKKKGVNCIGCPHAGSCGKMNQEGGCSGSKTSSDMEK